MISDHHAIIKKILDGIVREYSSDNKPFPIIEKIRLIKLNDPDSKAVIDYEPDYVIQRNISKHSYYYIVFEIIHGQDDIKTMADIARILGKTEIRKAIFISCSGKKKEETDRIISVLIGRYKKRFRKKSRKDIINIVSRELLSGDSPKDIRNMIIKEIKRYLPRRI